VTNYYQFPVHIKADSHQKFYKMKSKEDILKKHLEAMVGREGSSYSSVDEMVEQPEFKVVLEAMEEYKTQRPKREPIKIIDHNLRGVIDEIAKQSPLETRIRVTNEMGFISLLTELGLRENKVWTPEEDEMLTQLMLSARKQTDYIMSTINEWKQDGEPE